MGVKRAPRTWISLNARLTKITMSPTAMMVTNINRQHLFFTTPFSPEKGKSRTCEEFKNPDPNTDMAVKIVQSLRAEIQLSNWSNRGSIFWGNEMPEQTRCKKKIMMTGNRFDQSSILLHEDNGTKIKLKICNLRHNTVTSMFATQTMLASTILTDAILFKHEEQEKTEVWVQKLSDWTFKWAITKNFEESRS